MAGLTWLHLSDWHQGGYSFDRMQVLDALIHDIENRTKINKNLEQIDFIVFSGDVAFSGKAEEYQAAIKDFFAPILQATGLFPSQLFIVPGNHDFDRDKCEFLPPGIFSDFGTESGVQKWLTDEGRRPYVLAPFAAYSNFIEKYLGRTDAPYANVLKLPILNKEVALLGLNSALMCGPYHNKAQEDKGHLVLGEPQVFDALKQSRDADIRIAVMHHPFDWLAEFDQNRVKRALGEACHFILCGHLHQQQIIVQTGTLGDCVIIPAGASFNRRSDDPHYTNAYNYVHLDFESTPSATVYLRIWNDVSHKWTIDTNTNDEGKLKCLLPKLPYIEPPVTGGAEPPLPDVSHSEPTMSYRVAANGKENFKSISEAIRAASAGSRITVLPGEYSEALIIDKPLEIVGEGTRSDIILRVIELDTDVILFKASMGYIANLTLQQVGGGEGCSVRIAQGRLNLEGCDITSAGRACIAIQGTAHPQIRDNEIHKGQVGILIYDDGQGILEDNKIFNNATGVQINNGNPIVRANLIFENNKSGVLIEEKGSGRIESNKVYNNAYTAIEINGGNPAVGYNHIYGGKAGGIYVFNGGRGTLEYNDIHNNAYSGVAIKGVGSSPTLRGNRIHDNNFGGIHVSDNGSGDLEENDIYSNLHAEVEILTGGDPTLKKNRIHNGKEAGIYVSNNGRGKIEDNNIFENFYAGIAVDSNGNPMVKDNRICNNRQPVWIEKRGRGTFKNNDLRGNSEKSQISPDSQPLWDKTNLE